ncbi:orotidine-5'-phosphate decarboxylase [Bacillus horti]|uniref:Orotidine 5'-phosphate decarboxylase n=1 Tax=Caldalkalibacillus horti TaxID=77523 RepID=A0ABT9VY74_9BACI|nr:orotidine-5'-phosphate decarboxylase [Bacillus horti]MDQ0165570.1 orotidine-5'-phosphate decarboxylase [Bacillus horti]
MKGRKSEVIIALDYENSDLAWSFINHLEDSYSISRMDRKTVKPWLKVGMQLYYAAGPAFITDIKEKGYRVFLDLKLHDIPNTVKGAAQSITQLGVDMFNVHCSGGSRMMEAALEGIDKGLSSRSISSTSSTDATPLLIGVTQLTSTSKAMMNEEIRIIGELEDSVLHYASLTKNSGLSGVVCSPREVELVKSKLGMEFLTVTPGIRLSKESQDDQVRIMTHLEAQQVGTDYMVIGRAITQAEAPLEMYQRIMKELESGLG